MSAVEISKSVLAAADFDECNFVLFEDVGTITDLFPLAVLRPSWDIFCGMGTLRDWVSARVGMRCGLKLKPRLELEKFAALESSEEDDNWDSEADTIFLNGRLLGCWLGENSGSASLPRTVKDEKGHVLLARRSAAESVSLLKRTGTELADVLVQDSGAVTVAESGWNILAARYVWDYMRQNEELMMRQLLAKGRGATELMGAHIIREFPAGVMTTEKMSGYPVYVGAGAKIMPGVVFGNLAGPIWIGAGTEVEPHTFLDGPLYIGTHCRVKAGTRLYHGCSLGTTCRVAGEISASIFQSYVNKQHDGFVGNSHLGSWVNLGADTVTSNLRNDYGTNKVQVGSRRIDSGQRYIGLMCGDHTKTGINTMFNTATVVGIAANVYGADYPPKFIDSFMWGGAGGLKAGELQRTLETATYSMSRRGVELSKAEAELISRHYAERVNNKKEMA